MDCRTHERGVGMLNTPYVKKDTIKNFFPVPNAVFDLGLHHMEINIYAYLLRIEDRRTYQCIVSYDCNTDKLSILGTADGKFMPSSCLMVPVMRIDKCVRCCKRDGRECQHGITPVNVH